MEANYFTILYWFCHTLTWIHHRCTRVPHHETPSHLPLRTIPLGHPSAPAPSILYPALNLDWWFVSYMMLYMFQCHSPKSSHPLPLLQSPKDCSIHVLTPDFICQKLGENLGNYFDPHGINWGTWSYSGNEHADIECLIWLSFHVLYLGWNDW